ncbi:MAG TPA: DUF1249 domain-containing protein [Rhodocyclaceae bacterium]|nr:DUF1249 domain-containing protein [Rhodocyclaceae bacterium]
MTVVTATDVHTRIFHKLMDVVPDLLTIEQHGKSVVDGLMDLNFDVLQRTPDKMIVALSHYYRHPSGDMIADPDMVLAVYLGQERAEALSYQDLYSYREVYSQDMLRVDLRAKRSLNDFLNSWLRNLIAQGHRVEKDRPASLLCRGEEKQR